MAHIVLHPPYNFSAANIIMSSSAAGRASSNSKWCSCPIIVSPHNLRSLSNNTNSLRCASSSESPATQMEPQRDKRPRFKDFPYTSAPIRDLMMETLSTVETRLQYQLLPYTLPPDVEYYQNQSGTNHGSIFLLSGSSSSPIDIVFGSWLHCKVPTGAELNITTFLCYMKDSTDAPPLLMEFIQGSPTSLVILLDLPPRRDLVMHPDYLKTFYEETQLGKQRQLLLDSIPEAKPYESPSLYIQSAFSPTAILARVDTSGVEGSERRLEEIVREKVSVACKAVLETWLEECVGGSGEQKRKVELAEEDKAYLRKRDAMFKRQSIEIDLCSSMPMLFGQDVADRIVGVLKALMSAT